jgi:hypothetical protein
MLYLEDGVFKVSTTAEIRDLGCDVFTDCLLSVSARLIKTFTDSAFSVFSGSVGIEPLSIVEFHVISFS